MSADKPHRLLWYTRREGVERGPYPEQQISRYVLLGRIRAGDELRPDGGNWQELSEYPELIPELMKLPYTPENQQKLLMARMREDERQPGDRRERRPHLAADTQHQRRGRERRRSESDELVRHRELRYQVAHQVQHTAALYRYPLVASVLVVMGFLLSYSMERPEPEQLAPDCAAGPRPGVNWDNCNQVGLVATKADLVGARISNARMDTAQSRANHPGLTQIRPLQVAQIQAGVFQVDAGQSGTR